MHVSYENLDKSSGKHRPACQFGATCYRKNPMHRAEQSHPGDSDYEDTKSINSTQEESNSDDKPECPFGKACYRQNPQHKRDFKH
jgi:aprataxin and PNK-like factor